jgi:hypothetical protein
MIAIFIVVAQSRPVLQDTNKPQGKSSFKETWIIILLCVYNRQSLHGYLHLRAAAIGSLCIRIRDFEETLPGRPCGLPSGYVKSTSMLRSFVGANHESLSCSDAFHYAGGYRGYAGVIAMSCRLIIVVYLILSCPQDQAPCCSSRLRLPVIGPALRPHMVWGARDCHV